MCIWGFGFNDGGRPFSPAQCQDVVNWFKGQGVYLIGGVPTWWRTRGGDSRPGFLDVYHSFNMLSPWMVGRIGNAGDSDNFFNVANAPDQADCNANGIDYQPCVLPGDLALRQRAHGDFMWRQFYNMVRVGAQGIYISMYDEYNEGNQNSEDGGERGHGPEWLRSVGPRRRRHAMLVGLLPTPHPRRRPHAQARDSTDDETDKPDLIRMT